MAETRRSAAAAVCPGGDGGRGEGKDDHARGERRSVSPSPSKRRKVSSGSSSAALQRGDGGGRGGGWKAAEWASGDRPRRARSITKKAEASKSKENPVGESSSGQQGSGLVVERTAAVIRDMQAMFPPAPDATVLYRNQFLDLWACGRALEEPWAETWRRSPLVLHDSDLADAVHINLPAEAEAAAVAAADVEEYMKRQDDDFTETITKVLKKHPGPIERLRLDRTACPGEGLLREWMDLLSSKEVQELVLVNLTRPTELEFPLHRLRSRSLTTLALGFLALGIESCEHLASLQHLNLAGCRFSARALSAVVCRLPRLSSLTIGGCDVTAGCGPQGLTIDSRTLARLDLWRCTASALTILNAPALLVLKLGVTTASGKAEAVFIDLRSVPALQELRHLALHFHILRISSSTSVKVMPVRRVISLPCVDTLEASIHVCVPKQASVLVDVLCNLPRLQELILWRVDDLPPSGHDSNVCTQAWSLHLVPPCIAQSLEYLTIRCYRGGAGEIVFVGRVISTATRLVELALYPHHTRRPSAPRLTDAQLASCVKGL